MKNTIKLFGIIAIVAVIGFAFTACDDGNGNNEETATYTVTYNGNANTGGTAPTDGNSPYNAGSTVTVLGNTGSLVKEGQIFNGWNTADSGTGTAYTAGATFNIAANTTLFAQWATEGTTYTVTYNGNNSTGGAPPTDANSPYSHGAAVTVLGNTGSLVRTGHNFAGWNTAANGGGTNYTANQTFSISANTTLYAQWTPAGSSGVATNFTFRNAATNAPIQQQSQSLSMTLARNVIGPGGVEYEVDEESFEDYDWFYETWLGGDANKVGTGITPTKFMLPVPLLLLYGEGPEIELIGTQYVSNNPLQMVDFAQGVTLELGNIEPGTYSRIEFRFTLNHEQHNGINYFSEVSFPLPAVMNSVDLTSYDFLLRPRAAEGVNPPTIHTTAGGITTITAPLMKLTPMYIEANTTYDADQPRMDGSNTFNTLYFYGDRYKLYAQGEYPGHSHFSTLVTVPFEGIVIPEGAASVTFEIRWDLTNIIQQYTGRKTLAPHENPDGFFAAWVIDTVPNDGNDIFVLRNKFWEAFSITAVVN